MDNKFENDNDFIILFWLQIIDFEKYVESLINKSIGKTKNTKEIKKKNVDELFTLEDDK